ASTGMPAGELSAVLMQLELSELATRKVGDRYVRFIAANSEQRRDLAREFARTNESAAESKGSTLAVIDFVRSNYRGISRKYLQNYLAAYWCWIDRTRWHSGSL